MSLGNGRSVGSALSREVLASESFDVSDSAALFVGVRLFRNGQFAEVPFAIDDAVDLAYTFISLGLVTGGRRSSVFTVTRERKNPFDGSSSSASWT